MSTSQHKAGQSRHHIGSIFQYSFSLSVFLFLCFFFEVGGVDVRVHNTNREDHILAQMLNVHWAFSTWVSFVVGLLYILPYVKTELTIKLLGMYNGYFYLLNLYVDVVQNKHRQIGQ